MNKHTYISSIRFNKSAYVIESYNLQIGYIQLGFDWSYRMWIITGMKLY